ncbi:CLUMA_CG017519, isoform A [Clunio marinus]|uniref:CLUMA_CG017519, isoform A n=1 Tax=Clunio marinus TaxID=568069 RepID=A0A1J1IXJ1_9DIPT|nr:CLUMA_CG017519, isoform A [Clunio marinus]
MKIFKLFYLILLTVISFSQAALPDQSAFDLLLTQENNQILLPITVLYKTKLQLTILCESFENFTEILLRYKLTERICKENSSIADPEIKIEESHKCGHNGPITMNKIEFVSKNSKSNHTDVDDKDNNDKSLLVIPKDGIYILQLEINGKHDFNASVSMKFKGPHGFLTAKDVPMLHFYAFMCLYYILLAFIWLIFSALHWKDLLRIQFWVGAVIFLGMLEKACFYFEYQQANTNGFATLSLALTAELVSCVKRTLSRILVLIVSMGFGITKSRLGDETNVRISVISILYFVMASSESYLRLVQTRDRSENKQLILSAVPLALIDSMICWWIFTSLIQTIRALKLRRNIVKLRFYNHFKAVLIFGVGMSVMFMLYSIRIHKITECAWKNLWVDQAFWHVLFSILLTSIAFLWRPTANNQKYAFIPLLEAEEEDEQYMPTNYDIKERKTSSSRANKNSSTSHHEENLDDDTIKWVEENIASTSMLLGDSDEELMNTKFEISKMN